MEKLLTYTDESLKKQVKFSDHQGEEQIIDVYIPSPELIDAVNLTLYLKERPLLLMGEPGCGKTRLAEALAYHLHKEKMHKHFFRWNIKSATKAKDGIYNYDALKRLYHVNLFSHNIKNNAIVEEKKKIDIENINDYIDYGELVRAFNEPQNGDLPNILLIDEIDKAAIDFPNDLLIEIEKKEYVIPELGDESSKKATSKVIIIITSNQEKELPAAFLRRCLFFYIDFPDTNLLKEIVGRHFDIKKENALMTKAIEEFEKVRQNFPEYEKKPSTSELLDWFDILKYYNTLKEKKTSKKEKLSKEEQSLVNQLDLLGTDKLPFASVLLKTYESFINANKTN